MKVDRMLRGGLVLATTLGWLTCLGSQPAGQHVALAESQAAAPGATGTAASGVHDFDFLFGEWRVHHQTKPKPEEPWVKFEGTCTNRAVMGGAANVEDHTFQRPTGATHAVGLRAYDEKTHEWAIWWVDGRNPHLPVDPPMKGHFENGIGTFYADGVLNGKQVRTRFIWSHITKVSARWEQAFSYDEGKTWETNWIMDWERVS